MLKMRVRRAESEDSRQSRHFQSDRALVVADLVARLGCRRAAALHRPAVGCDEALLIVGQVDAGVALQRAGATSAVIDQPNLVAVQVDRLPRCVPPLPILRSRTLRTR